MTLEGKYLEELKFPTFLSAILGPQEGTERVLTSIPRPSSHSLLAKVIIENDDGERTVLDYIDLDTVQGGTEEATLNNHRQPVPWKIQMVLNTHEKRLNFQYRRELIGANVRQALEALRFQAAIAKGGVFKIQELATGFDIVQQRMANGEFAEPAPILVNTLENLVFIQNKTRVLITIPDRNLTRADVNATTEILQKVKTGEVVSNGEVTIGVDRDSAKPVIETFKSGKALRLDAVEQTQEVLGVPIPLGPMTVMCDQAYVPPEDLESLEKAIKNASPEDTIDIRLRPAAGHFMVAHYAQWFVAEREEVPVQSRGYRPLDEKKKRREKKALTEKKTKRESRRKRAT
jgi:hypothetical protein